MARAALTPQTVQGLREATSNEDLPHAPPIPK